MPLNNKLKKSTFYICITLLAIIWLIPVFFVFLSALKTNADFYGKPIFSIPKVLNWRNFLDAWTKGNISKYMINSIIVSCLKVPLGIFIEALAAFFLTRICSKKTGNRLFIFFLIGMMIPMQVTLVPLNIALRNLGLINTYFGLFIVYVGFGIPFGILVLRGFMRSIPKEIDEAALIDGCSRFKMFWSVILPITKPALATLMIMDFLSTWNEYMLASIFVTDDSMRTISAGLMSFIGQYGTQYGLLNAGVLISIVPVLIVYLLFQNLFVEGLSGSVKG